MKLLGDVLLQLMGLLSRCQDACDLLVCQVFAMSLLEFATDTFVQQVLVPQLCLGESLDILVRL